MQGRLWPRDERDREIAAREGHDLGRELTLHDLCAGENVFVAATGVSDGELLAGVRYFSTGALTQSLVMRSASGTTRRIDAKHEFARLRRLAGSRYEGEPTTAGAAAP